MKVARSAKCSVECTFRAKANRMRPSGTDHVTFEVKLSKTYGKRRCGMTAPLADLLTYTVHFKLLLQMLQGIQCWDGSPVVCCLIIIIILNYWAGIYII